MIIHFLMIIVDVLAQQPWGNYRDSTG